MPKKKKIIQVPMPEEMLYRLDELAHASGESRSHVIREAVVKYIANAKEAELDRQDEEGYKKYPLAQEEKDWLDYGAILLAEFYQREEGTTG